MAPEIGFTMRIPKARKISVDNTAYRWMLKEARGRLLHASSGTARIIVQIDTEKPGDPFEAKLTSQLLKDNPEWSANSDIYMVAFKTEIRPKHIEELIYHALKTGWRPTISTGRMFGVSGTLRLTTKTMTTWNKIQDDTWILVSPNSDRVCLQESNCRL